MMSLRARPILALLLALLILFALSSVVYALSRVLGYIPGVGVVDQSTPIRVLAKPVTIKQQGISVTVSKVVADLTRTFISYQVDEISFVENQIPACMTPPELHLPDGSNLPDRTGSGGTGARREGNSLSYGTDVVFDPIPDNGNQAIFVLSCVFPEGGDPLNFELPLHLVPAPAGYATSAVEMVVTAEEDENKTGLHLQKVLELEDSYILIGKFIDGRDLSGPLYMTTSSDSEYLPHIEDAHGNPVFFKVREDARPDPEWDVAYYWAYEVPKPVATPLTITVDQVNVRKDSTAQLQFETGDHPPVGQEWKLNKSVQVGSFPFTLEKITFVGNGYVLDLSYEPLPLATSFYISLSDNSSQSIEFETSADTQTQAGTRILHTITLTTENTPPTGTLTIDWHLQEAVPQSGPWSLVWSPFTTKP